MAEAGVPRPIIATHVRSSFAHLEPLGLINQIVFVITLTDSLSSEDRDRDNKTLYKTEKVKAIKRKKLYVIALADDLRYPSPCFAIRT